MASRSLTVLMLGAACYVLAVASQIGWLYFFAAFIWGLGAFSILLAWLNLKSIEFSRVILSSKKAYPGLNVLEISEDDELEIGIIVSNKSRFPKHLLQILEVCLLEKPGRQGKSFFLMRLGSRASKTIAYGVKCYRRGEFTFPRVTVEASSPFGILRLRKNFQAPLSMLVYPACYPLDRLPQSSDAWSISGALLKVRAGSLFCGSREYQTGDSLRHIHWRNSARRDTLMVKEFEETTRSALAITFDASRSFGQGKESTLEYAVKIAASASRYCTSRGMAFHLLPGQGSSGLSRISFKQSMEFLARLRVGGETNLSELLAWPRVPNPVLAIISLADDRQVAALRELSTKTRHLVVVALAGFARQEMSEEALSNLKSRDLNIILCRRGELKNVLRDLQPINSSPAREAHIV